MNRTPQTNGFELDQRLLSHPLAEIWRGRSFTGMEVGALVLSEAGSADPLVRDRLVLASRGAALQPGEQETPLWAANLSTDTPYATEVGLQNGRDRKSAARSSRGRSFCWESPCQRKSVTGLTPERFSAPSGVAYG